MFGIDDAIAAGSKLVDDVVTRIWPDATEIEKAKLAQTAAEINNQYSIILGQLDINKTEAANPSVFVAGARPAAMWVGVVTLFYTGIGSSMLTWIASIFGLPPIPVVSDTTSQYILTALLGIGGMRSFDKVKGTDTKSVGNK